MSATRHPVGPTPICLRRFRRPAASVTPALADSPHASDLWRWLGHQASRYSDLLQNVEAASRLRRTSVFVSR
jgi:hypothetical protein